MRFAKIRLLHLLCVVLVVGRVAVVDGRPDGWGWGDDEEGSEEKKSEESGEVKADAAPAAPAPAAVPPAPETVTTAKAPALVPFAAPPATALSGRSGLVDDHAGHAGVQQLNYANFNESCGFGENDRHCNPAVDMICSKDTKKCVCNPEKSVVYVKGGDSCLGISTFAMAFSCQYDDQCRAGPMGAYSVCNPNTGRCECLDSLGPGRDIIKVGEKCIVAKKIGDNCEDDEECNLSIQGYSVCTAGQSEGNLPVLPIRNVTKECKCATGYIPHSGNEVKNPRLCLPVGKDENSACQIDAQCQAGLGPLSRCFQGSCQCADVVSWKGEAVFYKGHCYIRRGLNETCDSDAQCKASINENAVCDKHESYLQYEKVCKCPQGYKCDDGDGAGSLVISINLVLMAVIATRVIP